MDHNGGAEHGEYASTVSDARFASVLDTAADGIVVINERAQVLAFNKACEKLFGYSASELLGGNVHKIMPADYAAEHDAYVKHYLDTGEKRIIGIGREVRGRHKDGTEFPIELSVGEASTPEGRQFIGILRDLRPRRSVETKLAEAQAQLVHMTRISAMDEMGAAIAHELNQPLTALLLYLQTVARKVAAIDIDPAIENVISKAASEAERAGEIIQRMRQLVEKKDPEREEFDAGEFAADCIKLVQLGAGHDEALFELVVQPDLHKLSADPVQIRQVLVNLLRNAREAVSNAEQKRITLEVSDAGEFLEFRICDTGPGVPPALRPELFRAFSGQKRKGLGLGLAISRSIAQNHGGDLQLEQGPADMGAVFVLRLPVEARSAPA
ncbi:MAG: PAS domain S-box protein [Roseibium sp.]|nr:PAS domain S-box protein [Roseibium sp.]